jgi:hypothetical protein
MGQTPNGKLILGTWNRTSTVWKLMEKSLHAFPSLETFIIPSNYPRPIRMYNTLAVPMHVPNLRTPVILQPAPRSSTQLAIPFAIRSPSQVGVPRRRLRRCRQCSRHASVRRVQSQSAFFKRRCANPMDVLLLFHFPLPITSVLSPISSSNCAQSAFRTKL